jgi:hypothetical protein
VSLKAAFARRTIALLSLTLIIIAADGAAQGRRGGRFAMPQVPANPPYDGGFQFCRIMFRNSGYGDGAGWYVDYPRADINLSYRLSELTTLPVSRSVTGDYEHILLRFTDNDLFKCPFIMMTEPGGAYIDDDEASRLRDYLLKGGFLWADDFWGEYAWNAWVAELRKALPSGQYPIRDLELDHPIFHVLYEVRELPQIPSINFWLGSGGGTSERYDSPVPHARAITDADGRMIVLMTHNTDFGDAFERETDDREYFNRFASKGYAFGINVVVYALTH